MFSLDLIQSAEHFLKELQLRGLDSNHLVEYSLLGLKFLLLLAVGGIGVVGNGLLEVDDAILVDRSHLFGSPMHVLELRGYWLRRLLTWPIRIGRRVRQQRFRRRFDLPVTLLLGTEFPPLGRGRKIEVRELIQDRSNSVLEVGSLDLELGIGRDFNRRHPRLWLLHRRRRIRQVDFWPRGFKARVFLRKYLHVTLQSFQGRRSRGCFGNVVRIVH